MATLSSKGDQTLEPTSIISNPIEKLHTQNQKMSDYEKTRDERIKQNLTRMQKLGIFDLSLKLKSVKPIRKNNIFKSDSKGSLSPSLPVQPAEPVRRSSRLQSTAPVSYTELQPEKENVSSKRKFNYFSEGSRPEEYTEEHEKLLGSTEMSWTLFVDGYGKDGKRIYDCVKGKTCHQCRQKTLGLRTDCSKCGMVQGQFCGDCLYMRYGEHVLEANENPEWICPVCRGICNCSLCRQAKGWAPTGALYKKVARLGFRSVAHYLIQTRRPQADSADTKPIIEDNNKNIKEITEEVKDLEPNTEEIKESSILTTEEVKESLVPKDGLADTKPIIKENEKNIKEIAEEVKDLESNNGEIKESLKLTTEEVKEYLVPKDDRSESFKIDSQLENKVYFYGSGVSETNQKTDDGELKGDKNNFIKIENGNDDVIGETIRMSKRKNEIQKETGGDSIGVRLRQRHRIGN